jgi:hypothetical protein
MRLFIVSVLLFAWLQNPTPRKTSKPKQQQSTASQQPANSDQRGTEQSPIIVKTLEPTKSQAEVEQEAKDRQQKTANDGWIVILTGILAVVAIGQLGVYLYQAIKLRETVKAAGEQSQAMERHIGEAARSATAMETIANTIEDGNQLIMRAYVIVTIGTAIYQQRRIGQSDLKFEGKATVLNTGNTPARKVRMYKQAAIIPFPAPDDFTYPIPEDDNAGDSTYATIGAHQSYIVSSIVPDFVPDGEVSSIKEGAGKVLCMWGLIRYEDIFGKVHTTKFAHWLTWLPNQTVFGYYVPDQNESD